MKRQRSQHKDRNARRQQRDRERSILQTVYHLLLAFVPFAAVVSLLIHYGTPHLIKVIEGLSRQIHEMNTVFEGVQKAFGTNDTIKLADMQKRISFALEFKGSAETTQVCSVDASVLDWISPDGSKLRQGSTNELVTVGAMTQAGRVQSLERSILGIVAAQLHENRDDIAAEAQRLAQARAEKIEPARSKALFRQYMGLIEVAGVVNQSHVKDGGGDVGLTVNGSNAVAKAVCDMASGFKDPPGDEEARSILAQVVATAADRELGRLKREAEEVEVALAAAPMPLEREDYREREATVRRCAAGLLDRLPVEKRGALTAQACRRVADSRFQTGKIEEEGKLVGALRRAEYVCAEDVQDKLRPARSQAERQIQNGLMAAIGMTNATDLAAFAGARAALEERATAIAEQQLADMSRKIGAVIEKSDDVIRKTVTVEPGFLAEVANRHWKGRPVDRSTPGVTNLLAKVRSDLHLEGRHLMEDERNQLEARFLQASTNEAEKAQTRLWGEVYHLPVSTNLPMNMLATTGQVAKALSGELLAQVPGSQLFESISSLACDKAAKAVETASSNTAEQVCDYVREASVSMITGDSEPVKTADVLTRILDLKAAPAGFSNVVGRFPDLPPAISNRVTAIVDLAIRQQELPRMITKFEDRHLPGTILGREDRDVQKAYDSLKGAVVAKLGNVVIGDDMEAKLLAKATTLVAARRQKEVDRERDLVQKELPDYKVKLKYEGLDVTQHLARCAGALIVLAGIPTPLPETVAAARKALSGDVEKAWNELNEAMVALKQAEDDDLREDLKEREGRPIAPGETPVRDPARAAVSPREVVFNKSAEVIAGLAADRRDRIQRKKRENSLKGALRAIQWDPDWFTYDSLDDAWFHCRPAMDAALRQADIPLPIAEQDEKVCRAYLQQEYSALKEGAGKEVNARLSSPRAEQVVEKFRNAFYSGEWTYDEWRWKGDDKQRKKIIAEYTDELMRETIPAVDKPGGGRGGSTP